MANCATCGSDDHSTDQHPEGWIGKAIKHPGALHRDLGVAMGQKIPEGKLSAAVKGKFGKKTAARARFAEELHGFHK